MVQRNSQNVKRRDSNNLDLVVNNPPVDGLQEISVTGEGVFGGWTAHEQIDVRDVSIEELNKMVRVDGQASALYRILTIPLKTQAFNVEVEPFSGNVGKREASFIHDMLLKPTRSGGMSISLREVISQMCVAHLHGYRVFEQVWKIDEKHNIVLDKISARNPLTLRLLADSSGIYDGFRQATTWQGKSVNVFVPAQKSVLFTVHSELNPLYGISSFLAGYYHYDKKHKMYYIAHLAHQINAVPVRVGKVSKGPVNKERRLAWAKSLADLGFNSSFILPEGLELDQFPKSIRSIANYMDLIRHHDIMMSKTVLAHFMDIGLEGGTGSWALSKNDFDVFIMTLQYYLDLKADVLNSQVIPSLIDWNFGTGRYPKVKFRRYTDDQKTLLKDIFAKVATDESPNLSDQFLYEMEKAMSEELGFNLEYDDDKLAVSRESVAPSRVDKGTGNPTPSSNPKRSKAGSQQPPDQNVPLEDLTRKKKVVKIVERDTEGRISKVTEQEEEDTK